MAHAQTSESVEMFAVQILRPPRPAKELIEMGNTCTGSYTCLKHVFFSQKL